MIVLLIVLIQFYFLKMLKCFNVKIDLSEFSIGFAYLLRRLKFKTLMNNKIY